MLTFEIVSPTTGAASPAKGTLDKSSLSTGIVKDKANASATGQDSFSFTVKDKKGAKSEPALVKINIGVANRPPLAKAGELRRNCRFSSRHKIKRYRFRSRRCAHF